MKKIFIDGSAGTTGLRICERLSSRGDLAVVSLPEEQRKDAAARRDALNACDVAFLCLPDQAAAEAAAMVENPDTVVIDTSTAHRVSDGWEYGFPELFSRRERIARSRRIANPGCHASGFIALVEPLVREGIISADEKLSSFSLTGYSGGGKKMIAQYADPPAAGYDGARQYALGQTHKHIPEMVRICALNSAPVFSPVVVRHMSGMEVTVALHGVPPERVRECYADYYAGGAMVSFVPDLSENGFISSSSYSGRDSMAVSAYGQADRTILVALFDNLGKGASGAAIQNMNIAIGCDEREGLIA